MCGGPSFIPDPIEIISTVTDPVSNVLGTDGSGGGLLGGLAQLDSAVNNGIPGGWATVGGAALMAAGIYDPELLSLADSGTLTEEAISGAGYDPNVIAQQIDPFAGVSANAPVDTTLSQAAADATSGLDYTAANPDFVGPTGTPDIPAADAAAQANQSSNILGNTTDASGNVTSTFDDGSTMTVDSSGNVIDTTAAPADPLNLKDVLDNPIAKKIGSTLANKAMNALLAPATQAISGKTGFKPVGQGGLAMTNLPGGDSSTGSESTGMGLTPGLSMGNPNYTLGNAPFTTDLYNVPTNPALTSPQKFAMGGYAEGGEYQEHNPSFYSEGGMENRYVQGDGDGTSDDVAAMLANGEFVIPADVVAALGNGSNDAGAHVLDQFLSVVREDNHSNDPDELPPESKGPLAYLAQARKRA